MIFQLSYNSKRQQHAPDQGTLDLEINVEFNFEICNLNHMVYFMFALCTCFIDRYM